jgi:hypothetical protein
MEKTYRDKKYRPKVYQRQNSLTTKRIGDETYRQTKRGSRFDLSPICFVTYTFYRPVFLH